MYTKTSPQEIEAAPLFKMNSLLSPRCDGGGTAVPVEVISQAETPRQRPWQVIHASHPHGLAVSRLGPAPVDLPGGRPGRTGSAASFGSRAHQRRVYYANLCELASETSSAKSRASGLVEAQGREEGKTGPDSAVYLSCAVCACVCVARGGDLTAGVCGGQRRGAATRPVLQLCPGYLRRPIRSLTPPELQPFREENPVCLLYLCPV